MSNAAEHIPTEYDPPLRLNAPRRRVAVASVRGTASAGVSRFAENPGPHVVPPPSLSKATPVVHGENPGPHAIPPPSLSKATPVALEENDRYVRVTPPRTDAVGSATSASGDSGPDANGGSTESDAGHVVVVKPYWAIASICLAVAMLTALLCLLLTGELDVVTVAFMAVFGVGLGLSSLGFLLTAPRRSPGDE